MVIMVSLLVKNAEKLELQRQSSQRDLKIHSNYKFSNYRDFNHGKEIIRVS